MQGVWRQAGSDGIGVTVRRYDSVTVVYGRTVSGFAANAFRFTLRARRSTHPVGDSAPKPPAIFRFSPIA